MDERYPPIFVNATPDDILAILRDYHRRECTLDPEAYAAQTLIRESTVLDWRRTFDFVDWRRLADSVNAVWSIDIPLSEWHAVLEPAKAHKLGEVCDLISRYAKVPRVRPVTFFGRKCIPAGVFLTIRSFLASAGADVRDVAPSTPLAKYTRRYSAVFLGPVSQLAPGTIPAVKIRTAGYHWSLLVLIYSWLGLAARGWSDVSQLAGNTVLSACATLFVCFCIWVATGFGLPISVDFGGLRTFRDLSNAVVAGARTADANS